MNLRVEREKLEHKMFFEYATFADSSLGRKKKKKNVILGLIFKEIGIG